MGTWPQGDPHTHNSAEHHILTCHKLTWRWRTTGKTMGRPAYLLNDASGSYRDEGPKKQTSRQMRCQPRRRFPGVSGTGLAS